MTRYIQGWEDLNLFLSSSTTQTFLMKKYDSLGCPNSKEASYRNSTSFMNCLEHARCHYLLAASADMSLVPTLLYYGYMQLVKACILTVDPEYPRNSSVLAHGVTSRKRKKKNYDFLQDEIRIQKDGLFGHIGKMMFHMKHLEGERAAMHQLIKEVPEMNHYLDYFNHTRGFFFSSPAPGLYKTETALLDRMHLTANGFENWFRNHFSCSLSIQDAEKKVLFLTEEPLTPTGMAPFRYDSLTGRFYLSAAKESVCSKWDELMIHYLLLFNLSIITRYEPDWWLEMLKMKPNEDYPLITKYLSIAQQKTPFLVHDWLTRSSI
ncbi:MAG: YaaC family protein [Bacillus sp. (in: firmicutes)]